MVEMHAFLAVCRVKSFKGAAEQLCVTQAAVSKAVQRLEETPPPVDPAVLAENIAFLKWLKSDHFVFLGARDYDYPLNADGDYEAEAPLGLSTDGLGILADPERTVLRRASEPAVLTRQMRRQLDLSLIHI